MSNSIFKTYWIGRLKVLTSSKYVEWSSHKSLKKPLSWKLQDKWKSAIDRQLTFDFRPSRRSSDNTLNFF